MTPQSIYTNSMDHPDITGSNFKGNSVGLKRVNHKLPPLEKYFYHP